MDRIKALIQVNLKIYFQRQLLAWVTFIFPVLFFIFFSWLFTDYDNVDSIPIGLIDEDQSFLSQQVFQALQENPSLNVYDVSFQQASKDLEYNRIEAIVTLKSGFEKGIENNDYKEIVRLTYLDKSVIAPALTDILVSDMLTYVTLYKSANLGITYENRYDLENLYNKIVEEGQRLVEDEHFEMSVITQVVTPEEAIVIDTNISKLLKYNTTIGYSLMILAFILMISQSHLLENRPIKSRLLQSGYKRSQVFLGDLISIIIIGSIITFVQVITLWIGLKLTFVSTLIMTLALLAFVILLSLLIMLLTTFIKRKVVYQSMITPLLFVFGLIGGAFWSTELLAESFKKVAMISPIYWTLSAIHHSLLIMYQKSFTILLFYALSLVIFYGITYHCYRRKTSI